MRFRALTCQLVLIGIWSGPFTICIIVLVFPVLALLRRRAPVAGLWVTGSIAAVVCAIGLMWFVQRVLAL